MALVRFGQTGLRKGKRGRRKMPVWKQRHRERACLSSRYFHALYCQPHKPGCPKRTKPHRLAHPPFPSASCLARRRRLSRTGQVAPQGSDTAMGFPPRPLERNPTGDLWETMWSGVKKRANVCLHHCIPDIYYK